MGQLLTTSSVLMCPHGGRVTAVTTNARVSADGAMVVRSSDTFTIAGCIFGSPPGSHPCVRVQWASHALRSKVANVFNLNTSSVGLCLAGDQATQGTALVVTTQQKVSGQ